ncbi:hypothetical protein EBME_0070 [bacterium endosymbiont of Mortierella elongata FMR23-6]|nr:hypothetical protein EBME_0070 [bacterium endosymbiont of Mortierella elongata FMR23-6]
MNDETIDVIAVCQSAMENKFAFIQPEKRLNRQLPINTARTDRQNLLKSFLLKYWPINHMPMVIITRPRAAGVVIFGVKAADIQANISERADSEGNQKKALPTSAKIPAATKPSIHFSADISAPITINRASISFRKSLISWRNAPCLVSISLRRSLKSWRKLVSSFSKSFLTVDSYSRRSALVANSAVSCEFLTAIEKAFACASGTPASLSVSTNCNVSNATAPMVNTSCLQILAQDFLCDGDTRKAANEGEYDPWSVA